MTKLRFLARAVLAASLWVGVAAVASAAAPEGSVEINYNRCDANYDGWAAHLWQRGQGGPAIAGVTWENGMKPSGKNDFGVYWHVPLGEFPQGKVNYILHKGDTKEQGGKDMQFDGSTTKSIWINSGDRKIYTSVEEARKGREENPCK